MAIKESNEERRARFKAMSSDERKALIREKMKAEKLQEGSGIPGKDLTSYDQDEIWELIQVTSFLPEMLTKPTTTKPKAPNRRKLVITWILVAIAVTGGMVLYYKQYPSPEVRKELSVGGMFDD
ncbi:MULTISPECIES: hypothetical protein [Prochlorococcus]|uniref:hypothetical protein n=1 Tax=Prochlorococcus TaxID=1218 RepID=UPI0005338A6D|nr:MULTISPECIES: hypothetical protein [Prochlorococcus]KGG14180.1 hypothetical protein EV05_0070 [Prochlorococcus sp. MIT 0601]